MNGKARKLLKSLHSTSHKDKRLWYSLTHTQKGAVRERAAKFDSHPDITLTSILKEI